MRQVKENRVLRTAEGEETTAALVARRLRERRPDFVDEFLSPDRALVPVPRSGLRVAGALWTGHELATCFHAEGFGSHVVPCLERETPVRKAATAPADERPKARTHFESLRLTEALAVSPKVTLVDDVVTRGAQLLGAAWRIWAHRPDVDVRAFVVLRTISAAEDFAGIFAPCTGRIESRGGQCYRTP